MVSNIKRTCKHPLTDKNTNEDMKEGRAVEYAMCQCYKVKRFEVRRFERAQNETKYFMHEKRQIL
jgi:hypothetical protein